MVGGTYQVKPPFPFTPGLEAAGELVETGSAVDGLQAGQRVLAVLRNGGGYAEEIVLGAAAVVPIPDAMDFVTAAAFPVAYGTSHLALTHRVRLQPGETLLVLGAAGGVGLTAVEIGKVMGARVIAAASTDGKLEVCKEQGADEVINYVNEDLKVRVKELTGGDGVDVIYDPVGGDYSEAALRGIAWGGRHLVIGFTAGEIPRIPLNLPLLKGCSIVGVFWGSFMAREASHYQENIQELLSWFSAGKLKPHISATYPLEEAAEALNDVMSRKVKGKVVLLIEDE